MCRSAAKPEQFLPHGSHIRESLAWFAHQGTVNTLGKFSGNVRTA
jgi:hypothetical protein